MAPRTITRSLFAYAIHGHTRQGVLDYPAFFAMLSELPFTSRRVSVRDQTTAIASLAEDEKSGSVVLRIVTGTPGSAPTLFDLETGKERTGPLNKTEIVAASAIVAVNPISRGVVVERRRPGVPISSIEKLLSSLGRENGYDDLTIALTPLAAESFLEELEEFQRIRRAEVLLTRPNFNWTTNAQALVGELASESDADVMEVAASAARGQSLRRDGGIVQDIKNFVKRPINGLKNVRVMGRRSDGAAESTLSLERHQRREVVTTPRELDDEERESQVMGRALEFVNSVDTSNESEADDETIPSG